MRGVRSYLSAEPTDDPEDLVELVVVDDAGHVTAWNEGPDGYARELRAFLS